MADPYNGQQTYTGPGYRVPFYVISPWTRGGRVYTEHADHNSQIMFVGRYSLMKYTIRYGAYEPFFRTMVASNWLRRPYDGSNAGMETCSHGKFS